jgi:hypothetical protein
MQTQGLFVFAGAGVSRSVPAGLPLFGQIRSELLIQLGLHGYVPPPRREDPRTERQQVADGLVPERFMLAPQRGGSTSEHGSRSPDRRSRGRGHRFGLVD